ncbi:MAG: tetratricopeptide repeat protein, partial [Acetobacteraceae bacterium]|nr:tetratricopeptide repeat protein [Acetobacteraceae bacterium]
MTEAAAPHPPREGPPPPARPAAPRYVVLGEGAASPPSSRASRVWQLLRQLILALVPIGIALFFIAVVAHQLRRGSVEIGRIEVPARLVEAGLTPEVVARRLVDALDRASDAAEAEAAHRPMTMLAGTVPDFSVPVAGISLRSLAELVRDLFGLPKTEVSGEILLVQDRLSIRLRLSGRGEVVRQDGFAPHEVDALLAAAAPGLWRALQPQIYAWHIAETLADQEEVLRRLATLRLDPGLDGPSRDAAAYLTAQALLRANRPEEALGAFAALTRARPEYPQGWSGTAQALAALDRPEEALAALAEAVRRDRPMHLNNLFAARLLLESGRAADALEEAEAGLRLRPEQPDLAVLRILALGAAGRADEAVATAVAWRSGRPDLA